MSRNIKSLQNSFFNSVAENIQANISRDLNIGIRRELSFSAEQISIAKSCKIKDSLALSPSIHVALLEFGGKFFFITQGLEACTPPPKTLSLTTNNKNVLFLVSHEAIDLSISNYYSLYDHLSACELDKNDQLSRYDFSEIEDFFTTFNVYEVDIDFLKSKEPLLSQLLVIILITHNSCFALSITDLKDEFHAIAHTCPSTYPFERICDAILSTTWSHIFLEIYRTIEGVFGYSRVTTLLSHIKCKGNPISYCEIVEDKLGWKAKEHDAIITIFAQATGCESCFENFHSIFKTKTQNDIATKIYDIRNSIVHFRASTRAVKFSAQEWSCIITTLLRVSHHWYTKLENDLPARDSCIFSAC